MYKLNCVFSRIIDLQGEPLHWLCSAMYEILTQKTTPSVSLTKLLRACNIKLYEFLKKTERYLQMVSTSRNGAERFKELREGLSVSLLAYEKYKAVFNDLFVSANYSEEAALAAVSISTPQKGGKKAKAINKCTPNNIYEFCWYLFLSANCENPTIDLVTSFHIILCCIDIVYSNIVADKREDLLNMNFAPTKAVLAEVGDSKKTAADPAPVTILVDICKYQKAEPTEVLAIKSHNWRNLMTNYFNTNLLKGNATTFLGLFSAQNYDYNINSLRKRYEMYTLSSGKIDEGIFLWQPMQPSDSPSEGMHSQIVRSLQPETPLTRRNTLPHRDPILASPVSNATQNVSRLHQQLDGVAPEPSAVLRDLFRSCIDDPLPGSETLIQTMRQQFCDAFRTESANERFELALKLFYRLLENIIRKEKEKQQNFDQKVGSMMGLIMKLLLATSVEIVIYAYGVSARFPWILQCFDIEAFHFYKLIEIIVTNHDGILNRDLIKHLNAVSDGKRMNLHKSVFDTNQAHFSAVRFSHRLKNSVWNNWRGTKTHRCGRTSPNFARKIHRCQSKRTTRAYKSVYFLENSTTWHFSAWRKWQKISKLPTKTYKRYGPPLRTPYCTILISWKTAIWTSCWCAPFIYLRVFAMRQFNSRT